MSRNAFARITAIAAIAALLASFNWSSLSFEPRPAHAVVVELEIVTLRIRIETGSDDLRSASEATAFVEYEAASGNELSASKNLNNGTSWSNGSVHTVNMAMPAGVTLDRLDEFGVRFKSGQSNPFETGDNWNMQSITVTAILEDGSEYIIVQQAGTPLHRFKSDEATEWRTLF